MPRRERPPATTRSEHWLRVLVNEHSTVLNTAIAQAFGWPDSSIDWRSPCQDDGYAEYFDQEFLDRLGIGKLQMPLDDFWPRSGPRWDGLARTEDNRFILVEAKAHIEEAVDYGSRASKQSLQKIEHRLDEAKSAFKANPNACWYAPLYQMANRLAHLYYLAEINQKDAYLIFVDFANAPDVPRPVSCEEWQGATRLAHKCLGLKDSRLTRRVGTIIVDLAQGPAQPSARVYKTTPDAQR